MDVVLKKLIMANRLGCQFDLAYTLVSMILLTPVPRAIEANAWVSPAHEFNLPRAASIRGMIPEFTSGQAYYPRPSTVHTWENYKVNPERLYIHSVAITEAVYTGLFEVMTNGIHSMESSWYNLGIQGAGNLNPYRVVMECASLRFGKAFELKWDTVAGPDIVSELLTSEQVAQRDVNVNLGDNYEGYEVFTRTTGTKTITSIRARYARPVLFPVLSMGINDNRYYLNALNYETHMTYDYVRQTYTSNSASDTNKMLVALRVAGYDATAIDVFNGRRHRNWAANSNGQVMPDVRDNGVYNLFIIERSSIVKRKKSWADISFAGDKLSIKVSITPKTYATFLNGKLTSTVARRYSPVIEMPIPSSSVNMSTAVIRTNARLTKYMYKDFQLKESVDAEVIPSRSVPVGTAELHSTEEMGAGQELAATTEEPEEA